MLARFSLWIMRRLKLIRGPTCNTLAKKSLCFPAIAPAPSVQMLIRCFQNNLSFFSLVSTAEKMSSPVRVPNSDAHMSKSSSGFSLAIYLTNTSTALNRTRPWIHLIAKQIFFFSLRMVSAYNEISFSSSAILPPCIIWCNSSRFNEGFSDRVWFFIFCD